MKYLQLTSLLCVSLLVFGCVATPPPIHITKEFLVPGLFAEIKPEASGLSLKFKSNGSRYLIPPGRITNYEEVLHLPFGASLRLQDKHAYLQFLPLDEPLTKSGFLIEIQADDRDFEGTIRRGQVMILLVPSRDGGPVEWQVVEPDFQKARTMLNL